MGPATATCVGRQQLQLDQSFIRHLPPQQVVDRLNVSSAMSVNTGLPLIQRHTGGSASHLDVRDGCSCSLKIKRNQHNYLQSRGAGEDSVSNARRAYAFIEDALLDTCERHRPVVAENGADICVTELSRRGRNGTSCAMPQDRLKSLARWCCDDSAMILVLSSGSLFHDILPEYEPVAPMNICLQP
ncbi:hypothetical protein An03g05510 [Aspergillus niger]|uniref:Uncharacterized protein n=2 Tax=Aspergillus niger TaxID=5061 RepID=A2QH43_ASPNC|nr:hypothetical protein An03g05510 [Aspergillus niger]CAK38313.1 hypothetical protein An03g05510 [Aspergillus niger]